MQTSPLSEEQAGLINTLDTTNRRLVKLNKSLLLLTKIENNQYPETESIEAGAVCQRLMQQYSIHAESKRITMEGKFDHPVPLSVNPALFEILIGNLLSNAIRYNRREGRIQASTSERELTIANTGVEGPLAAERIFERFHKQTGTPEGEDGTGLGLAIVQHICHFYHYTIRYTYAEGMHRFTLGFRE
jgi:signal transduction histidine kinase